MRYLTTDFGQHGAGVGPALPENHPIESSFQAFLMARDVRDREPIASAVRRKLLRSCLGRASRRSPARSSSEPQRIMGRRGIVEEAARLDRRIANRLVGLDVSDAREPDEVPNPTAAASVALKRCRVELDRQAHLRLTPKSATRWWRVIVRPTTGRWTSARDQSRRSAMCERRWVPTRVSFSITR